MDGSRQTPDTEGGSKIFTSLIDDHHIIISEPNIIIERPVVIVRSRDPSRLIRGLAILPIIIVILHSLVVLRVDIGSTGELVSRSARSICPLLEDTFTWVQKPESTESIPT